MRCSAAPRLWLLLLGSLSCSQDAPAPPATVDPISPPVAVDEAEPPEVETEEARMRRLDPKGLLTRESDDAEAGTEREEPYGLDDAELQKRTWLQGVSILPERFEGRHLGRLYRATGSRLIRPDMAIRMGRFQTCRTPDDASTLEMVDLLVKELAAYPPGVLEKARLQFLLLCADFSVRGKRPAGEAVGPAGTVVLDTGTRSDTRAEVLHHEVMHMMDQADLSWKNEWKQMNRALIPRYAAAAESGGADPCFVTEYAHTDTLEDRAELYAWMVTRRTELAKRMRTAPCIAAKVELLTKQLDEFHPGLAAWVAKR